MLILDYVEKNRCKGSNGVSYYPFPVLCRDTTVVSRQEGHDRHDAHGKHIYSHDKRPARAHAGVPGECCCNRPPFSLCCDRVGSPCVATWVFRVVTRRWAAGAFGVTT